MAVTTDECYLAIKNNDLDTLKEFLAQNLNMSAHMAQDLMHSLVGYAIKKGKPDVVKYLMCEANVPAFTLNNWFVKWSWYINQNKEIYDFLIARQKETK